MDRLAMCGSVPLRSPQSFGIFQLIVLVFQPTTLLIWSTPLIDGYFRQELEAKFSITSKVVELTEQITKTLGRVSIAR